MDGVLADFEKSAANYRTRGDLNRATDLLSDEQQQAKREFYLSIEGTDFYKDLPVMAGAKNMLDAARAIAGVNIFILTKVPAAKNFVSGENEQKKIGEEKINWILSYFADYFTQGNIIIVTGNKSGLIQPTKSDILIDDRPDNIAAWESSGGMGILFITADEAVTELRKLT